MYRQGGRGVDKDGGEPGSPGDDQTIVSSRVQMKTPDGFEIVDQCPLPDVTNINHARPPGGAGPLGAWPLSGLSSPNKNASPAHSEV